MKINSTEREPIKKNNYLFYGLIAIIAGLFAAMLLKGLALGLQALFKLILAYWWAFIIFIAIIIYLRRKKKYKQRRIRERRRHYE